MNQMALLCYRLLVTWSLAVGLVACSNSVLADEPGQTISDPGFRPDSEYAADFLDTLGTAEIAVLPTLVRRVDRTAHSFASQQQIVAFLNESGIATADAKSRRINLGPLRRPSQWEIFQYGAESIAAKLEGYETGADYTLVMELLVPGDREIFGIEVYIVGRQGQSAFSFLLNSHHQIFADANLFAKNSSEASREKMIENATRVGVMALKAQIEQARECTAASATIAPIKAEAGILHDFQSQLASNISPYGIPLGLSTFSDGSSAVSISLSDSHPPVPDEAEGNRVMQLSLDVTGWAGVISLFADEETDTWVSQDWTNLDGFSFWLYGNGSGTEMLVDVLDNRNPCSRRDDAERYTYVFLDDVSGWRQISVPFADMSRKEIGNGAPSDGLNLTEVHGWGLGTLDTGGPRTYYIDDFRLWSESPSSQSTPFAVITHELFIETRVDQSMSRIVVEPDRLQGLVVEKVMGLTCAFAQLTADRGYRYFIIDERAKLSGERSSFRITFYRMPPEGVTVVDKVLGGDPAGAPDLMTAAINAEKFIKACRLMGSQTQTSRKP